MQDVILRLLGLITNPNELALPDGAATVADNVELRRPNLASSRRGWAYLAKAGLPHRSLVPYDGAMFGYFAKHSGAGDFKKLAAPNWTSVLGMTTPAHVLTAAQAEKNLYFPTTLGVKRLSGASGTPVAAGGVKARGLDRGQVGSLYAIGALVRTGGTTVTCTTAVAHGFSVGQQVAMTSAGEVGPPAFANGTKTVASVTSSLIWTYEEAGTNGSNGTAQVFQPAILVGTVGFLTAGYQCAYRVVFGFKDAKGYTHYGSPSARTIIANDAMHVGYSAGVARNVVCRPIIPAGLSTSHFFQVYRSEPTLIGATKTVTEDGVSRTVTILPSDDCQLVYQDYLKASDIAAGRAEFTDINKGGTLFGAFYDNAPSTNRNTEMRGLIGYADGERAAPPFCLDLCWYKDRMLFGGTTTRSLLNLTIMAVGGSEGIQNGDKIVVNGVALTATTGTPTSAQFKIASTGSNSQNVEQTALNLCDCINQGGGTVHAYYASTPDGEQGKIVIEDDTFAGFDVVVYPGSKRACFNPVLPSDTVTPATLTRSGTTVTATVAAPLTAHSYRVGENVVITSSSPADFASGTMTVLSVTATAFTYKDSDGTGAGPLTGQTFTTDRSAGTAQSSNFGVMFSRKNESEAVPFKNNFQVGTAKSNLLRCVALTNRAIFIMDDGVWEFVGEDLDNFAVFKITDTVRPIGRGMVAVVKAGKAPDGRPIQEAVYFLTETGFCRVNGDGTFEAIDGDINTDVLARINTVGQTNIGEYGFAYAHQSNGQYECWLPTTNAQLSCPSAFVFNVATGRWTTKSAYAIADSKTCGVINPADDLLYLGDNFSNDGGGDAFTWKECRALAATDFNDDCIDNPAIPTTKKNAITKTVTFAFSTAGAPSMLKRFAEVLAMFIGTPSAVTIAYANEYGSAGSNALTTNGSQAYRDYVRRDASMGRLLRVTLTHSVENETFDLAGLAVKYEVLGTNTAR